MVVIEVDVPAVEVGEAYKRAIATPHLGLGSKQMFTLMCSKLADRFQAHLGHRPVNFVAPDYFPIAAIFHIDESDAVLAKLRTVQG